MLIHVYSYIGTALVFLALDSVWLSTMASRLYRPLIGPMLAPTFSVGAAATFYFLYVAGIVVFAVAPALAAGRWQTALLLGAFFGLVAYGTYDLTNQATLKDWPVMLTVVDLMWGTVVTGSAATGGFFFARWMAKTF